MRGSGFRIAMENRVCNMGFYVTTFSSGADEHEAHQDALERARLALAQRSNVVEHGEIAVDEMTLAEPKEIPEKPPGIAWFHE